ncbi:DUF2878 domain-containing protein [Pseudomonas saliphila]|uniref:DUF2878 domain-containing protein n=1 Tax=Pseudomonas saliphila TaxID=2586906 RepID=UPI00123BE888|nr:DUF2878 domain-containing protein [Pseudomonas saliphila]
MSAPSNLINASLFIVGWLACVLGGSTWWLLIPLVALTVHFVLVSSWSAEGKTVVSVMLAGATLDSFLLQMNVLTYPGDPALVPLWQALVWALLGTTLNHCLAWSGRSWWLASAVGAVAALLCYSANAALRGVGLGQNPMSTLAITSISWAVLFPLLHGFAQLYREQHRMQMAADKRKSR